MEQLSSLLNNSSSPNSSFNLIQQQMQLQLAIAAAAASAPNSQFSNPAFSNILSELYLQQQQQQQQQQQDLLLATYLQPLLFQQQQQSATPQPQLNKASNKRSIDDISNMDEKKETDSCSSKPKLFKCTECKLKFDDKKELKKHAKIHNSANSVESNKPLSQAHPNELNNKTSNSSNSKNRGTTESAQLYECVKCELLFRNYEMYCAHKSLHQVNESKENSNVETDNKQPDEQIDQLKCLQCGMSMPNAIQYILHIQTFHSQHQLQSNSDQILSQLEQQMS